jgi:hypothetical protein
MFERTASARGLQVRLAVEEALLVCPVHQIGGDAVGGGEAVADDEIAAFHVLLEHACPALEVFARQQGGVRRDPP